MRSERDFQGDEKVIAITKQLPAIKSEVLGIEVNSPDTQAKAAGLVVKLKGFVKEIETRRKKWVAPFNDVLKVANSFAKIQKEPIEKLIKILTPALIEYQEELDRAARKKEMERLKEQERKDKELADLKAKEAAAKTDKQQEKIQEKIEVAQNAPVAAPVKVENTVKAEGGSVSFRKHWTFQIVKQESVPREFLKIDETAIRQEIKKGCRYIAGLTIYEEKTLSGRS